MDGPALKDSPAAERRSIWLNYAVLFYTVIAFAAVLFVANAIICDLQHPLGPDAAEDNFRFRISTSACSLD